MINGSIRFQGTTYQFQGATYRQILIVITKSNLIPRVTNNFMTLLDLTNAVIISGEAAPDGGIVVNTPPGKKFFFFLGFSAYDF